MESSAKEDLTRVLIVEDEAIIAEDLKRRLERMGYAVVGTADNGDAALELAGNMQPDLVLMDIRIRGPLDGIETATELMLRADVPVIFLTAHTDAATLERAKAVMPYGYLVKPFEDRELKTAVEMACYRHGTDARGRLLLQSVMAATVGIAIADAADVELPFVLCNPALETISGYPQDEILGLSPCFLAGAATDPEDGAALLAAMRDRRAQTVTLQAHRKDGTRFWAEVSLSPVNNLLGKLSYVVVLYRDVTQAKHTEQAFAQSQKMEAVGQLTGGIAHDFNNILAVITSFTGLVHQDLSEGDPRRDDLSEVLVAAKKASGLIRQLLSFSRLQPSVVRPIDVSKAAENLRPMLERSLNASIRLEIVPSIRPAVTELDSVQLDQVLLNIALNARDAMPDGGVLRVEVSHPSETVCEFPSGSCVRIVVSDTGHGMDGDTLDRVFEPFFTTKPVGTGTGLGLATSYAIVRDAGGRMGIESTRGRGTTVTIDLPESDAPARESEVSQVAGSPVCGAKVLVVEDNDALLRAAVRILGDAGYDVTSAKDGADAVARIQESEGEFDLIISDVVMPGLGGYALADYASIHAPQARVILTSGHTDGQSGSDGSGRPPLLWKPYTSAKLLRAARNALIARWPEVGSPMDGSAPPGSVAAVKVLVIEDDDAIRNATRRVLAGAGYEVVTAESAAAARASLEAEHSYSAVLCDLGLPDGSGAVLLDWLSEARPALARRTIVVTGGAADAAGRKVVAARRFQVLRKPVEVGHLLESLDAVARCGPESEEAPGNPTLPSFAARSQASAPQLSIGSSVLLVEDEGGLGRAYTRALESAGFSVALAKSGEEALRLLGERSFDVVATDIGLPGIDGLALLREARALDPDLPVVLLTGAPSVETARLAVERRAVAYLTKPFEAEHLVRETDRAVKAGQVLRLQRKLLAARSGADEFLGDIPRTLRSFESALSQLHMVFQPIVRAYDGSIFGYEALLRSNEPSLPSPLKVIGAAEALGRMDDLGKAVRRAVGTTIANHPERTEAIFVNLHPSELQSELLCTVTEPLLSTASRIVLEVTERTSLSMGPELSEEMRALRESGYRIAIDDLGEGYAGLSWLANLRPDIAKIDMSLVRDVHRLPLKRDIVGSLVNVCRGAGIVTIGEGVETVEEARVLTELGCDLLQGYYFAKPGPAFPEARSLSVDE